MKIKITLIAFFATALMFTSCVKNEVSPGIEDVRSAYAELLSAKAQAEIIAANADANFVNAQAAVQQALAAVEEANAAAIAAASADASAAAAQDLAEAQADLANLIEWWTREFAADDLRIAEALADYQAQLVEAANDMALDYFESYVDALDELRGVQGAIFAKQAMITALQLDIANGTTNGYDAIAEDLAAANGGLDVILAEYEAAKAFLGDVDAVIARIGELNALLAANDKAKLDNTVAQIELDLDLTAEQAACDAAEADYDAAVIAAATAAGVVADAAALLVDPFATFDGEYPMPEFWNDELQAVQDALDALAAPAADTLATYILWNDKVEFIADGTDDLDVAIANAEADILLIGDTIVLYEDSLVALNADTTALGIAYRAAEAAIEAGDDVYDAWVIERQGYVEDTVILAVYRDAIDTIADGSVEYWIIQGEIDDLDAAINVIDVAIDNYIVIERPLLVTARDDAQTAYNDALAAFPAAETAFENAITALEGDITALEGVITGLEGDIVTRLADIAQAEADLPDLYSDYLHALSWFDELLAAYEAALAHKELIRPDYEEYMDAFYYDYVAGLEADLAAAVAAAGVADAAVVAAQDAWDVACAAYALARAPLTELEDAMADLVDAGDLLEDLLVAYGDIDDYNVDFLEDLEIMIADQVDAIAVLEDDLADAEEAYATGIVDYDKYMQDLEVLAAELAAAQSYVAYWKALLDAALATS